MIQRNIDFIKGWVKTTFIDFPGKIATVIYTEGCNLRCPICHNPELIMFPDRYESIDITEIFAYIEERKALIDGIVLSGGEPLFHPETLDLLAALRPLPVAIKLDTNGYFPERLEQIVQNKSVDMIAMDVKGSPSLYPLVTGIEKFDIRKIESSLEILRKGSVPFEIRTTVIPQVIDEQVIADIAAWISPVDQYVLQQFRPVMTLDPQYRNLEPLSENRLNAMAEIAREVISNVTVRGIA